MQREPGESGGCGVSAADIRWTQSTQDFYPSSSRMIDRLRELTVNAMIYASLAKDEVLRRVGLLGEGGPCVHFIYLHHVFGDESAPFRELLGRLSRKVQFLSHSDAVSKVQQGSIDRVYASLSFDDGLVSCLEGARILEDFGARGCFFVCPAVVDRCRDPQWIARWCRERLQKTPAKVMGWGILKRSRRADMRSEITRSITRTWRLPRAPLDRKRSARRASSLFANSATRRVDTLRGPMARLVTSMPRLSAISWMPGIQAAPARFAGSMCPGLPENAARSSFGITPSSCVLSMQPSFSCVATFETPSRSFGISDSGE